MKIFVYYLKSNVDLIEDLVKIKFKKALDKMFVATDSDKYIFYSQFNCIAFIGYSDDAALMYARKLNAKEDSLQVFEIEVDESYTAPFLVKSDKLIIKNISMELISIAALTVMQSVGLDICETKLEEELEKSKELFIEKPKIFFRSRDLMNLVGLNVMLRHELIIDLRLLDKPMAVWDDDVCDGLYGKLSKNFELKERFDIAEHKIELLRNNLIFMLDNEHNEKSIFLEWIIILLISLEAIMDMIMFLEYLK